MVNLPSFKYHPDPIATGSVVASTNECVCCGRARGFVYALTPFGEDDYEPESICPWCIADGRAASTLDCTFISGDLIDDAALPPATLRELCLNTPGFASWQEGRWFACCDDAGAFLGAAGHTELAGTWQAAIPAIQRDSGLAGADWDQFLGGLRRDGPATAYVFRCLHCGTLGGYSDFA